MVTANPTLVAAAVEKTLTDVASQQPKMNTVPQGGVSPFQEILGSISTGEDYASNLGMTNDMIGLPSTDITGISAENIQVDLNSIGMGLEKPDGMEKVVNLLSEVNNGQQQMDRMVNQILFSGTRFNNQELLAIQAQVFHFAQITELVVKAADQGVSSLKAVLNTNIQ